MENNKVTAEEEQQQDIEKLGKLCSESEKKACRQKWLATLCLSGRRMCNVGATGIELYQNDFATTVSSCIHPVNT